MNRREFQKVALLRRREAKVLLDQGCYAGAYYLLGYAVECAIKACLVRRFRHEDLPDRRLVNDAYTHDLVKLMKVAELEVELKEAFRDQPALEVNWATVKDWTEAARYDQRVSRARAFDFWAACTDRKSGVLTWIRSRW